MDAGALDGRLLVALPALLDPNFARTVVLLLQHGADGAVGVVLNRPSDTEIGGPLPGWSRVAAHPPVVFVGGPVAPGSAIGLARPVAAAGPATGWAPLSDHLGTVDLNLEPEDVGAGVDSLRVFTGYAGWGAGQLEAEIDEGAWLVVDALPGDAFSPSPKDLWRQVLRRQRGRVAWLANFPPDLRMN